MKNFSVTVLGSSAALPTSRRNLSAHLVAYSGQLILLDCGEGTQMMLKKLKVRTGKISHIFISHLHGDHFYGLIGLISTWHLLGRKTPLYIYGPPVLKEILDIQLRASMTELSYPMYFHNTQSEVPAIIADTGHLTVTSVPLKHRVPTTCFLISEKPLPRRIRRAEAERYSIPFTFMERLRNGEDFTDEDGEQIPNEMLTISPPEPRSYAYCSDTAYDERLPASIKGCTLLYHEATFLSDRTVLAGEKMHSTAAQAAQIAGMAGAGSLLIGHFSARYNDVNAFRDEAEKFFKPVIIAEDGETYEIICKGNESGDYP